MRNWDPLSIFKYLTGSPTLHATMFIALISVMGQLDDNKDRAVYKDNANLYDEKHHLVKYMNMAHGICFFVHLFFETGMISLWTKTVSIIQPSISLFV